MKKIVKLLLPALFFCGIAFSQVLLPLVPKDYGKKENRANILKALHIPMKTLEILSSDTSAQIFYNPLDSSIWAYSLSKSFFKVSGSATDTSHLNDRINLKLNITDTTNKWIAIILKRNDSVFFKKGNVEVFAYKDSIGSGGGSTDTSHLSDRIDDRARFVDVKDTIQKVLDYMLLNSVSDFSSFNKYAKSIVVKDTLRGGTFNLYSGSDAADGGMIFADALGRKWMRQVNQSEPVNVQWFGFVADGVTDNYPAFLTLKTYLINHRFNSDIGSPTYTYFARLRPIIFPAAFNYYKFSQTLNFEYSCTILGAPNWTSKLLFPADSVGIALWWVDQYAAGTSSVYNLVQDIAIYATIDGTYDTTAIGIKVRSPSNIIHVSVDNFGGAGLDFNSTDPITSNTDFCRVVDCRAYYNLDGMYVKGGEANVIRVYDCDFSINRRWGVKDIGFLGNFYYACHASSNGTVTSGQYTYVIHRTGGIGIRYQYAAKRDGFLTMPGDSTGWQNDWVLVGDSTIWHNGYAPDYLAGTHYWQGGSYYLETGTMHDCYDEAGSEMGRYLGLYGASIGGTHGAGFQWNSIGVFQSWYSGKMNLNRPGAAYAVGSIGFEYSNLSNTDLTFFKTSGQGLRIAYDTVINMGEFKDLGTGTSRTKLTSLAATAATYGRSSFLEGMLYGTSGFYIGSFDDSKATMIIYGTTVPASGTWAVGDLVIKKNVSAADVWGWRCITAGTPGTWETLTFTHVDSVTSKWSLLGNFGTGGIGKLGTKDNQKFSLVTNNTARIDIENDGRILSYNSIAVGNGVTPSNYGYILDLLEGGNVNARIATTTDGSSGGRAILNFTAGIGSASNLPGWRMGLNTSSGGNNDFTFDELNSGSFIQRWKVQKGNGYFGINKTTPAFRLHVGGMGKFDSTLWITTEPFGDSTDKAASTAYVKQLAASLPGGGSTGWGLTGNSGTTAGTNFIGNTDSIDWVIKTNNIERLRIKANGQIYWPNNKFINIDYTGSGSYTRILGATSAGAIQFGTTDDDVNTKFTGWGQYLEFLDGVTNHYSSSHAFTGSATFNDSLKVLKYKIVSDSDSAWVKDPITGKFAYAKINAGGGGGATAAQLRRFGSTPIIGTDANISAAAGDIIYLPSATLSANRTIDVSGLNTDGDYLEIYNNEAGFTWSFTGATVYLLDRTATASTLVVDGVYKIRRVSGKLIINN